MSMEDSNTRSIMPDERAVEGGIARQVPFRYPNRMKVTIKMIREASGVSRDQGRLVINGSQVYTVIEQLYKVISSLDLALMYDVQPGLG